VKAAAAALALAVLAGGCQRDVEKSDAAVDQKISQADMALELHPGKPESAVKQANKAVDAAKSAVTDATGASDVAKAQAQIELAIAQLNLANITIAQVNAARAELGSTLTRMDMLSSLIGITGKQIADEQKFQPTVAQQTITDEIAAVQGGPDKPVWKAHATAPLPSLSAVSAKIESLNHDIDGLQEQRKQLADDQADSAKRADALTTRADQAKGKAAVDLYKQAADVRKTAMDKAAQIDQIDGQLQPLQQQLALAQSEQTDLKSTVDQMQKSNADLADGWKKVQDQIDAETARIKDLMDGSGGAGARQPGESTDNVDALAKQWVEQSKSVQALRTEAAGQLAKARSALDAAVGLYQKIGTAYSLETQANPQAAQKSAWTAMIDLYSPGSVQLRLADVEETLADVHQGAALDAGDESRTLDQLQKALTTAQLTVPDELSSLDLSNQQKTNRDLAEKAFNAAEEKLKLATAQLHGPQSEQASAKAAEVIELYDHGQFELAQGDEKRGDDFISQAKTELGDIQQANGQLPPTIPLALLPPPSAAAAPAVLATQPAGG
jgi:predicted nuclease with TOPRIM domain